MPSHPPIPLVLSPYINQPSASLTLLTSTLGATASWLVLRYAYAYLKHQGDNSNIDNSRAHESAAETRVVLVSWLRDASFWKDGARKLGMKPQRVYIVDALSCGLGLGLDGVAKVEDTILRVIDEAGEVRKTNGKVFLILDGLDFLLAATGCSVLSLLEIIGELREHVDGTIITSCADLAIIQSSTTPLETSHAAFVMSVSHQAITIMSVRGLDTGFAKDVSGVLRIGKEAGVDGMCDGKEEREYLYFIEGDGGAKVFERGA